LGKEIANIIASRSERVAIVASGGMSHYPGTWKYPHPEFEFDSWLLGELELGNGRALIDMTSEQLDEVGNTELLTWAILLGAIGDQEAELICYTPTWHHGHAMVRFIPGRSEPPRRATARPAYRFKNSGFEFYRHPPASAYRLNKLLFEIRHDTGLRQRLLCDLDLVARQFELTPEEKEAARVIPRAGSVERVSDLVEPLVKAGAHPLHALMSLHAVAGEYRKLKN